MSYKRNTPWDEEEPADIPIAVLIGSICIYAVVIPIWAIASVASWVRDRFHATFLASFPAVVPVAINGKTPVDPALVDRRNLNK